MCYNPRFLKSVSAYVPCNKCVECRIHRSREWAMRIVLEARQYERNCMITLTYDDDHLPLNVAYRPTLVKEDYQKFLKRLRRRFSGVKLRYFLSGEYGKKHQRPHFHIILFNFDFEDRWFYRYDNRHHPLYRSPTLEKLWDKGYSGISDFSYESALYVASYLQKVKDPKIFQPAFTRMSLKPGIGAQAVKTAYLDTDKIYVDGKFMRLPDYFLKLLSERGYDDRVSVIRSDRRKKLNMVDSYPDWSFNRRKIERFNKRFGQQLNFTGVLD